MPVAGAGSVSLSPLAQDDIALIVQQVEQYAQRFIAPAVERPEQPLAAEKLAEIVSQAVDAGLLGTGDEEGVGLWENLDGGGLRLSVEILVRLAAVNAGVAFQLHQLALGRWLVRAAGAPLPEGGVLPSLQGHYGLGRHALARYFSGREFAGADGAFLHDWLAPAGDTPIPLHSADVWRHLMAPRMTADGQLGWHLYSRADLDLTLFPHSHGFDELRSFGWCGADAGRLDCDAIAARGLYAGALHLNALGLMSIALGCTGKALALARQYTATRRQGGAAIARHPAVQLLLAGARGAVETAEAALAGLCGLAPAPAHLARVFSLRAELHLRLCRAANDALQTFGGTGYMRDVGMEKIVRDNNTLRLLAGTPAELHLFAAEWERLHG
ncbi:MAG: hypothetical protein HYV18_04965 [Gammaproteobacteria bacterium]|nr:hypothetical protein [Gammaproteobacteria bacterium]